MKEAYDFDKLIERKETDSYKWGMLKEVFGRDDLLPMWIADMDFPSPKPVIEALRKRVEHGIYGYAYPKDSVKEAFVERVRRKFSWVIEPEWVVITPGSMPAIHAAIRAFTRPGDKVILQSPVFTPFWKAIRNTGRQVLNNKLLLDGRRYLMDYEGLRKVIEPPPYNEARAKLAILCSPHNPVGRVWSESELRILGNILLEHDVLILADEIWAELVFRGRRHVPFASISGDFAERAITIMAPSKTFNLAGIQATSLIIPNDAVREAFLYELSRAGISPTTNVFGLAAMEAAYRYGDPWLEQLLTYLEGSLKYLVKYVREEINGVDVVEPEGTYLAWLDFRELGLTPEELSRFLRDEAKVALEDGYLYGPGGEGFERMNFGTPRKLLEEGLRRIRDAVKRVR